MIAEILALLIMQAAPSAAVKADPAPTTLSLQDRGLLRCSAALAIVAHGQEIGNEDARRWPEIGTSGQEFFVRALAGLMDRTGLDRDGISALVSAEAQRLWDSGEVDKVMPSCLVMMGSSGT